MSDWDVIRELIRELVRYIREHPWKSLLLFGGLAASIALPPLLAPSLLSAAGFGAAGVGVGTLAAAWQSSVGSVVTPSLFALLQSAGAAGGGLGAVVGALQAAGVGGTLLRHFTRTRGRKIELRDIPRDGRDMDE